MTRIERPNANVPVIIQQVAGDLRVRGRSYGSLIIEGDNPHAEQIGEGQPYLVRCDGDCRLMVPSSVTVVVQQVGGDAKLTDLTGHTDIGHIGGDLTLREVQSVQVKAIGGALRIKRADGDVTVKAVGSDATVREVTGSLVVDAVGADLYIRNVGRTCIAHSVGGDLVLNVEFLPDVEYRFRAGGDILCRVEPDANARFIAPLDIALELDVPADVKEEGDHQIVTLGEGGAVIIIEDGSSLRLVGEEEDYVLDLGVQIEEEVEARLSTLEEKLSQQLEGLDERIQAKTEQYVSQAERMARQAQEKAQRAAERFRRNMERDRARSPKGKRGEPPSFWGAPPPPPPPTAPRRRSDPVSEQERLMILQMVRENKISIEEAERLLAALDSQD